MPWTNHKHTEISFRYIIWYLPLLTVINHKGMRNIVERSHTKHIIVTAGGEFGAQ